jgi:hypothetical protein
MIGSQGLFILEYKPIDSSPPQAQRTQRGRREKKDKSLHKLCVLCVCGGESLRSSHSRMNTLIGSMQRLLAYASTFTLQPLMIFAISAGRGDSNSIHAPSAG